MSRSKKQRPATHKTWRCPKCEWVYDSPVPVSAVQCWGGIVGKHEGREMKPMEVYT